MIQNVGAPHLRHTSTVHSQLKQALSHLQDIVSELDDGRMHSDDTLELAVALGHILAHICKAWNELFRAEYGEHEMTVALDRGLVQGRFPRRALAAVLDWYRLHQDELARNWELSIVGHTLTCPNGADFAPEFWQSLAMAPAGR